MLNFGNKEFRNLQEQVLKNAQDIETLKGREDLQIVIVNELPAVGNPNYIYLVAKNYGESPDVYDEYIWLENEQRYEKIGGVSIDLTNYVTTDSAQNITGTKSYTTDIILKTDSGDSPAVVFQRGTTTDIYDDWKIFDQGGYLIFAIKYGNNAWSNNFSFRTDALLPLKNQNIGIDQFPCKNIYLSEKVYLGASYIGLDNNRIGIYDSTGDLKFLFSGTSYFKCNLLPYSNLNYDIGSDSMLVNRIYARYVGNNAVMLEISNIASKATSTFISGSFDTNGESTIDTEQAGTPEGLFIFTYGNCQCFLRLTATMVQNADTAPIRVACPMIHNSGTVNGWLNITKSGNTLILKITDGTNHVDSGYAWTLTKTNLL